MNVSDEFLKHVDGLTDFHLSHLKTMGITGAAISNAGLIGFSRVDPDGQYWQPEGFGIPALILPVGPVNSLSSIVDMVAFHTNHPDKWWLRTGHGPLLGYYEVSRCGFFGEQLTIYSNPLQWLQAGCDGAVILDWDTCLPFWLSGVENIYCPDPATGDRLSEALQKNIELPQIRVGGLSNAA